MHKLLVVLSVLACAVTVTACITVNIYFPAPEVRRAAEEIVDETWGPGDAAGATTPPAPSGGESSWMDRLSPARAHAQEANIDISTAAIRQLKDAMRARAEQLKPWLAAGKVGVARDGSLVIRNLDGVALRDQATIRRLVDAENRDRQSLYREIAKANKYGDDRIPDIQRIFAETWIQKADRGWWIQQPNGTWTQK